MAFPRVATESTWHLEPYKIRLRVGLAANAKSAIQGGSVILECLIILITVCQLASSVDPPRAAARPIHRHCGIPELDALFSMS
jgi:hypothetical protein